MTSITRQVQTLATRTPKQKSLQQFVEGLLASQLITEKSALVTSFLSSDWRNVDKHVACLLSGNFKDTEASAGKPFGNTARVVAKIMADRCHVTGPQPDPRAPSPRRGTSPAASSGSRSVSPPAPIPSAWGVLGWMKTAVLWTLGLLFLMGCIAALVFVGKYTMDVVTKTYHDGLPVARDVAEQLENLQDLYERFEKRVKEVEGVSTAVKLSVAQGELNREQKLAQGELDRARASKSRLEEWNETFYAILSKVAMDSDGIIEDITRRSVEQEAAIQLRIVEVNEAHTRNKNALQNEFAAVKTALVGDVTVLNDRVVGLTDLVNKKVDYLETKTAETVQKGKENVEDMLEASSQKVAASVDQSTRSIKAVEGLLQETVEKVNSLDGRLVVSSKTLEEMQPLVNTSRSQLEWIRSTGGFVFLYAGLFFIGVCVVINQVNTFCASVSTAVVRSASHQTSRIADSSDTFALTPSSQDLVLRMASMDTRLNSLDTRVCALERSMKDNTYFFLRSLLWVACGWALLLYIPIFIQEMSSSVGSSFNGFIKGVFGWGA